MLKVAVVILIVVHVYAGLYCLTTIVAPKKMLESTFEAVTGKALDTLQDADHLKVMTNRNRKTGFYALISVIFSFFVLFTGFQKAEKWAWWCFLIGGGIAWLGGLIDYIVLGSKMHIVLQAIGTAAFLVGILLPVKVFFAKEVEEVREETRETEEA